MRQETGRGGVRHGSLFLVHGFLFLSFSLLAFQGQEQKQPEKPPDLPASAGQAGDDFFRIKKEQERKWLAAKEEEERQEYEVKFLEQLLRDGDKKFAEVHTMTAKVFTTQVDPYSDKSVSWMGQLWLKRNDSSRLLIKERHNQPGGEKQECEQETTLVNEGHLLCWLLLKKEALRYDLSKKDRYFPQLPLMTGFGTRLQRDFTVSILYGLPPYKSPAKFEKKGEEEVLGHHHEEHIQPEHLPQKQDDASLQTNKSPLSELAKKMLAGAQPTVSGSSSGIGESYTLELIPKAEPLKSILKKVLLRVDKASTLLVGVDVLYASGKRHFISLSDVRINEEIKDEVFKLDTRGAKVINK